DRAVGRRHGGGASVLSRPLRARDHVAPGDAEQVSDGGETWWDPRDDRADPAPAQGELFPAPQGGAGAPSPGVSGGPKVVRRAGEPRMESKSATACIRY